MDKRVSRRAVLSRAAAFAGLAAVRPATGWAQQTGSLSPLRLGYGVEFSFDALRSWAQMVAAAPYRPADTTHAEILDAIDFDAYQQLKFKPEFSLTLDRAQRFPIQLFHLGKYQQEPVRVFVVENGAAREAIYTPSLFDSPPDHPARKLPDDIGFAGFRVMHPNLYGDWLAFLGASYFRSAGPFNQYGLSARGLAIDTGLPTPEEFPRFTNFWLQADDKLTVYALMESPSVTGAYRFRTDRVTDARGVHRVTMDVDAELIARKDITRLGIAPFSSMFWYGEAGRARAVDWRPEIHDADGLAIWTGAGERIWRPLNNPPRIITNTFLDRDIKGFGLLQRDRDFVHYLDDGVFYERRPSVWVEPLDAWGEGAVHLLEIPTDDEIHDNIAIYWCPAGVFQAGTTRSVRYRLTWLDDIQVPGLGRVTANWTGAGGRPGLKRPSGVRKFVIDFQGPVFARLGPRDGVQLELTVSRGTVSNVFTHPVQDQRERWRALFDLAATGPDPVDMRGYLRLGDRALTETWLYQYFPEA